MLNVSPPPTLRSLAADTKVYATCESVGTRALSESFHAASPSAQNRRKESPAHRGRPDSIAHYEEKATWQLAGRPGLLERGLVVWLSEPLLLSDVAVLDHQVGDLDQGKARVELLRENPPPGFG